MPATAPQRERGSAPPAGPPASRPGRSCSSRAARRPGKSWSCAEASGSDLIGRTLWIGIGEDDPDEYANVPGADFEIVEHDGTYRDILAAIDWAAALPPTDGKPNLIVVDSMTRLWDLLCDMAQETAAKRAERKRSNSRTPVGDDEVQITMDLWNQAKDRWGHVVDSLRSHQGPTLLTARLEEVTVMVNGKPSGERALKVKTEKGLPYDVGGIVQLPERGKAYLTGVRTTRMQVPERSRCPGSPSTSCGASSASLRLRSGSGTTRASRSPRTRHCSRWSTWRPRRRGRPSMPQRRRRPHLRRPERPVAGRPRRAGHPRGHRHRARWSSSPTTCGHGRGRRHDPPGPGPRP
jgi:hypothetical protein